ncbi:hypothetical protein QOZ80_5AG0370460 [Eleusine coracana subsp. coracana]|nr:hypothetical protein QOZ80_5AG0370460 [Eleusine coracana subsp. coracana]
MSWSDLPAGLVAAIADELTDLPADLARFRSVCPSWRSATAAHAVRVPLLLLPTEGSRGYRRFWSVADDRLREIPVPANHAFLFASYHGWMLAVARDMRATLVFPFTGDSAGLPTLPFSSSSGDAEEKTIRDLAWDWSPHGVVVSPGKGEGAFFCRQGDESWRPIGCSSARVTSITYCQGSFYLFDGSTCTGTVVDAETQAVVAEITKPPTLKTPSPWHSEANLVVSPGELLLLVRTQLLHTGYVVFSDMFKVFRADRAAGGGRSPGGWSEVVGGGIGDRAVFVDHFRAFCVEASGVNGVRGNCMYGASAHEEVNDDYGMDVNGRYTVEMLDLADLTTKSLWNNDVLCLCVLKSLDSWFSSPNSQGVKIKL